MFIQQLFENLNYLFNRKTIKGLIIACITDSTFNTTILVEVIVKEALPQADILIYEEEGTVLGFLGLQDSYIAGLFVEKASQSRGIGRLLLEAAKSGRQELTLHAYAENTGAVRFYEREGFQTAAFEKEEMTGCEGVLMRWTREKEKNSL